MNTHNMKKNTLHYKCTGLWAFFITLPQKAQNLGLLYKNLINNESFWVLPKAASLPTNITINNGAHISTKTYYYLIIFNIVIWVSVAATIV